jgi:hypothetical protein
MARLKFADLLPLYRSTEFGATAEDDAEVTVATPEIAGLLKNIDADDDSALDAGIALIDDVSNVAVGAKVKARIDLPRIALGLLAWNVGDLVAGSGPRVEEPARYFLIDTGYAPGDDQVPDVVIRYRKVLEVVALLAKCASFLDRTRAELIFVKDGKVVLPVNYGTNELMTLDVAAADMLLGQFADDLHREQKLSILFETIVDLCRSHELEGRFAFVLRNLRDIADKLAAGYRMFASSFSYAKIKGELEDARIDYTQKIHKTIVDIQNQLLGIPVATIVVASQLKAPTACGPELWVNFGVLIGAWIFVVLLLVAIINQWLTLSVIGDEIERQQTRLREEFAAVSDDFANTFTKLKGRITWHRWVLGIVALIGIAGGVVATYYKNSVSALPPIPCASAPKPDAEVGQDSGTLDAGNETASPAANLVADDKAPAVLEPPAAVGNASLSVVGNAVKAGAQPTD